jgi:hypothetical protein
MTATRLPDSLSHELQIRSVFLTNLAFRERGSRRLGRSNDHVNARSTDGDRDVDVVNLLAEWKLGRADAVAALTMHSAYVNVSEGTFTALAGAGHTMMRSHKKRVGDKLLAAKGSARAEVEEDMEEEEELNDGPAMPVPTKVPTADVPGKLSLFDQEKHMQANGVLLAIHKERSSVLANLKSQRARSAAAVS